MIPLASFSANGSAELLGNDRTGTVAFLLLRSLQFVIVQYSIEIKSMIEVCLFFKVKTEKLIMKKLFQFCSQKGM